MDLAKLYFNIASLAGFFTVLGIGIIVYIKNKSTINKFWFLSCISAAFWSLFFFLIINATDKQVSFILRFFLDVFVILVVLFWFNFVSSFLGVRSRPISWSIIVATIGMIFANSSSWFAVDMVPKYVFNYYVEAGEGYYLFALYFFVIVVYGLYLLIKSYKKSTGVKATQIKHIIFGSTIGFIGGGSAFLLSFNIPFPPHLFILFTFFPLIIAYAITRYRLMDVLVIIRRSTVYALTVLTLAVFSLMLFLLIASFFILTYNTLSLVVAIILLVISLTLFSPLEDAYTHFANKYFFASLYETEKVFQDLVKKIPAILDLDELLELISQILVQTFKVEKLGIWFINTKREAQALKTVGFTPNDKLNFVEENFLLKFLEKSGKPLLLQEIEQITRIKGDGNRKKFFKIKKEMIESKVAIILPLIVKKELVGLSLLGPKLTTEAYTEEDVEMLEILANQSASALENAKLYTETQHFAETMKQEVIKATKDLRRLNQQLKRLDAAKSEFISIASHQLRTPLTAIKGYVSMVMDGDFGPVNHDLEEPLKRVYLSNQRLIDLVENLLNISRMESGRMQYYFEPVDLVEFVDGLIKDLQILADRKGIYLKYNKPTKPLTKFFADQEKLRQIVMNLIDNAIKYTKVGGITIAVKEEENTATREKKLIFIVQDTGMGIDPADLPLLFQKFERGKGVSLVHTEGTGLGLYVCKQLVEAHKGRVWAESEGKGKGSRFIAEFPVLDEPPKVDTKPVSPLGQPVVQITSSAKPTNLKKLPELPEKR